MTPAQLIAITHPCFLGGETIHERYRHLSGRWSLILTVNCGHE
jgi:hypothetical protein